MNILTQNVTSFLVLVKVVERPAVVDHLARAIISGHSFEKRSIQAFSNLWLTLTQEGWPRLQAALCARRGVKVDTLCVHLYRTLIFAFLFIYEKVKRPTLTITEIVSMAGSSWAKTKKLMSKTTINPANFFIDASLISRRQKRGNHL
jgi:hypothetical protein